MSGENRIFEEMEIDHKFSEKISILEKIDFDDIKEKISEFIKKEFNNIEKVFKQEPIFSKMFELKDNFEDLENAIAKEYGEVHKFTDHDSDDDELYNFLFFQSERKFLLTFSIARAMLVTFITKEEYERCLEEKRREKEEYEEEEYEDEYDNEEDYYDEDEEDECSEFNEDSESTVITTNYIEFVYLRDLKTNEFGLYINFIGKENKNISETGRLEP